MKETNYFLGELKDKSKYTASQIEERQYFITNTLSLLLELDKVLNKLRVLQYSDDDYELLDVLEEFCNEFTQKDLDKLTGESKAGFVGDDSYGAGKISLAMSELQSLYSEVYEYQNAYVPITTEQKVSLINRMSLIVGALSFAYRTSFNLKEYTSGSDLNKSEDLLISVENLKLDYDEIAVYIVDISATYPTSVPYLVEHPELLEALSGVLTPTTLDIVIDYGKYITEKDIIKILENNTEIDEQALIAELEERVLSGNESSNLGVEL